MTDLRPNLKAVAIGSIADIVTSITMMIGFMVILVSPESSGPSGFTNSRALSTGTTLIGAAGSVFGGYLAGRIAKTRCVLNGMWVGAICVLLALAMELSGIPLHDGQPVWGAGLDYLLPIPISGFGGSMAARHQQTAG